MVIIVTQIHAGSKAIKKWYGCSMPDNETFLNLYSLVANGTVDKTDISIPNKYNTVKCHVHIGKSVTDKFIQVQPDLEIGEVVRSLGIYVEYVVQLEDYAERKKDTEDGDSNVFSMLMQVASDRAHLPYRAKLCRAKFSSGEIIRRAKFWSLSEKFVTFARRKIRNLSYFMRTQYNLYICAPSKNYSSGEIFVRRDYSSGEIFVTWRKIRHFRPTKFRPIRYLKLRKSAITNFDCKIISLST